jgi:protein-S-isoprenylcysteine O-methyltransferase Ste14
MNTTDRPTQAQSKRAKVLLRWVAYPLALIVWGVVPWAISLLTPRYGWEEVSPSPWNLLGLILVLVGTTGLIGGLSLHSAQSPSGIEWDLDKSYLLTRGLYAFSRNPMYLSELTLLLGWVIFYGSFALLITLVIWYLFFNYSQVPLEERVMEAHFGDGYREYKKRVPRWFRNVRIILR